MELYKCRTCGKPLAENAITCPHCGDVDAIYNNYIKEKWNKWSEKIRSHESMAKTFSGISAFALPIYLGFAFNIKGHWWQFVLLIILGYVIYFIGLGIGNWISDQMCIYEKEEWKRSESQKNSLKTMLK